MSVPVLRSFPHCMLVQLEVVQPQKSTVQMLLRKVLNLNQSSETSSGCRVQTDCYWKPSPDKCLKHTVSCCSPSHSSSAQSQFDLKTETVVSDVNCRIMICRAVAWFFCKHLFCFCVKGTNDQMQTTGLQKVKLLVMSLVTSHLGLGYKILWHVKHKPRRHDITGWYV